MDSNRSITRELLPPNFSRFIHALRNVGYSFEEAVADIIDNSIDAGARNVHLRFIIRESLGVDLLIADDGRGMNSASLREAMRFGSDLPEKGEKRLGLFGLGLKLASIAYAESVWVVSLSEGDFSGRAWTNEGLKEGFACDLLDDIRIGEVTDFSDLPTNAGCGTWVYWERLFRFEDEFNAPEKLCEKLLKRLQDYLGLHLHRLLRKTEIVIDIYDESLGEVGAERAVDALDPFGYVSTGVTGYPIKLNAADAVEGQLDIQAHIWPANSPGKEYKLPGGANKRQGFYFYRNDRLLSGGSWHGMREEEPHSSLARVAIDLHVDVERKASVDVRKAQVKLTPEMQEAIANAKAADGTTFKQFLAKANASYRTAEKKNPMSFPLIPKGGYPADLTRMLQELLDKGKTGSARTFDFEWHDFVNDDVFFEIERQRKIIWLNEVFRELFRTGQRLSKNDGTLTKTLLFIVLRDLLDAERLVQNKQDYLDQLNKMLAAAARAELRRRGF